MSSAKWRSFCRGLNVLRVRWRWSAWFTLKDKVIQGKIVLVLWLYQRLYGWLMSLHNKFCIKWHVWNSFQHRKQSNNSFPIVDIFFRGCVSEMVVLAYSVIYYIYIYIYRDHWDFVSIICVQPIDVQSMVFANDRIHYGLQVVFVCLQITPSHYHHYADSSEGIELIKCFRHMLPSVCLRLRLFSQLSFIQYMGLCVFSLPNSPVMVVRMCTLSYYHHQIGSMNR